jgi:glycerol-3-phosphate dehydrogenase (NAD(P)+)
MRTVALIGDGQMGLVLADALAYKGVDVTLWGPFKEDIGRLLENRTSPRLTEFTLDDSIAVTADGHEALAKVDVAINAIPTQFIRHVWAEIASELPSGVPVGCVAKGIEIDFALIDGWHTFDYTLVDVFLADISRKGTEKNENDSAKIAKESHFFRCTNT